MVNAEGKDFTYKINSSNFLIRIHFKQNTDWQGIIHWLETNKTVPFRSVLELIFLLNEAIDLSSNSKDELNLRSWNNEDLEKSYENDNIKGK